MRKEINIDEELEWEVDELNFENNDDYNVNDKDYENIATELDLTHIDKFVWNMSTLKDRNESSDAAAEQMNEPRGDIESIFPVSRYT